MSETTRKKLYIWRIGLCRWSKKLFAKSNIYFSQSLVLLTYPPTSFFHSVSRTSVVINNRNKHPFFTIKKTDKWFLYILFSSLLSKINWNWNWKLNTQYPIKGNKGPCIFSSTDFKQKFWTDGQYHDHGSVYSIQCDILSTDLMPVHLLFVGLSW